MIPEPVIAVFFLYPLSEKQKAYKKQESEKPKEEDNKPSSNVFLKFI